MAPIRKTVRKRRPVKTVMTRMRGRRIRELMTPDDRDFNILTHPDEKDRVMKVLKGELDPTTIINPPVLPKHGAVVVIPVGRPRNPRAVIEAGFHKISGTGIHNVKFEHDWDIEPHVIHSHMGRWILPIPWFNISTFTLNLGFRKIRIPYPSGIKIIEISLPIPVFTLGHDKKEMRVLIILGTARYTYIALGDIRTGLI